jgi:hypothetical protein
MQILISDVEDLDRQLSARGVQRHHAKSEVRIDEDLRSCLSCEFEGAAAVGADSQNARRRCWIDG